MVNLFNYLRYSKNKRVYKKIARQYKTTLRSVYGLAHGRKAKSTKDYEILKELTKQQIIEGVIHK